MGEIYGATHPCMGYILSVARERRGSGFGRSYGVISAQSAEQARAKVRERRRRHVLGMRHVEHRAHPQAVVDPTGISGAVSPIVCAVERASAD